jgi:hypothetical protein
MFTHPPSLSRTAEVRTTTQRTTVWKRNRHLTHPLARSRPASNRRIVSERLTNAPRRRIPGPQRLVGEVSDIAFPPRERGAASSVSLGRGRVPSRVRSEGPWLRFVQSGPFELTDERQVPNVSSVRGLADTLLDATTCSGQQRRPGGSRTNEHCSTAHASHCVRIREVEVRDARAPARRLHTPASRGAGCRRFDMGTNFARRRIEETGSANPPPALRVARKTPRRPPPRYRPASTG